MLKMNKIALGTVQFGLDYGISNSRGKIPKNEVFEILNKAYNFKIKILDTAESYGKSEQLIGSFIAKTKRKIKVITKVSHCNSMDLEKHLEKSLKNLNINTVYAYLLHDFNGYLQDTNIWESMKMLKKRKKVQKIGFSIYYTSDLEELLKEKVKFDILQIPYSIFDRRFETYFKLLKKMNVEIHVRSIFLQGLVFKKTKRLSSFFNDIKGKIEKLNDLSVKNKIPISAICMNFVMLNNFIDKVVVGVENIGNLLEHIEAKRHFKAVKRIMDKLLELKENNKNILIPINWNKGKSNFEKK
jgi:aryl-alcohol dehydrogenase-like predicted oxidoreductase